jgi:hypothetical protein
VAALREADAAEKAAAALPSYGATVTVQSESQKLAAKLERKAARRAGGRGGGGGGGGEPGDPDADWIRWGKGGACVGASQVHSLVMAQLGVDSLQPTGWCLSGSDRAPPCEAAYCSEPAAMQRCS